MRIDGREYVEAPWKTCGECGRRYQVGGRWHNHFLCGPTCCGVRWAKRHPEPEEDDTYYG